jgi:hypothetical protein
MLRERWLAYKKTKQGQRPALGSSSFIPVASACFFFGVAAIGRAAGFPPSDLDHTRLTDNNVTLWSRCWPHHCEWITRT